MRAGAGAGCRALLLGGVLAAATAQAAAESRSLRYALAPGQTWHCTQTIERELRYAGETLAERGETVIRYRVAPADEDGWQTLRASILSQSQASGGGGGERRTDNPFELSAIHFQAQLDARGVQRGSRYRVDRVEPPKLPGLPEDPEAFRQLLESFAAAWLTTVFWMPELPERALAPGDSFDVVRDGPVRGSQPGVRMRRSSTETYTLRALEGSRARFDLRSVSSIHTETAQSELESRSEAQGSAVFDLELGMWLRREIRTQHRAEFSGAPGIGAGETAATTRSVFEMLPGDPG